MPDRDNSGTSSDVSGDLARETLTTLGPHLRHKRFRAGELLWREGDTDGMLVFLETGTVKVYRLLPDGRTVTLFLFGPGTVFGFMPFLDGDPYPAYAQVLEDAEARIMPRSSLLGVLKEDPKVAVFLLKHLSRRLRAAFDQIERFSSRGAQPKVAAALYSLLSEAGERDNAIISLPQSSREFAALIGLTPESFSRTITDLVEENILHRLGGNRFQVLDVEGLRTAARPMLY